MGWRDGEGNICKSWRKRDERKNGDREGVGKDYLVGNAAVWCVCVEGGSMDLGRGGLLLICSIFGGREGGNKDVQKTVCNITENSPVSWAK